MRVFLILVTSVITTFYLSNYFTGNTMLSLANALIALAITTSILTKIDFNTWNPFK